MAITVRAVGAEAFEDIHPLLLEFHNRRMGKEDWRRMVFEYPWWDGPVRGHALYANEKAVGFMGAIFARRTVLGRPELFCGTSCWVVRPEHRNASLLLLRPMLALRDHTLVNLTPSPAAYQIFAGLGFKPLESEQLLLPPIPRPAEAVRGLRGGLCDRPEAIRDQLEGEERTILDDLSRCPVTRHVLLRQGGRRCYLVATPRHVKGVRFAELQYIGDRDFFWENRILAHAAFLRSMGALGLAVDGRFAEGRRIRAALRRPARRLYRPSRPDIAPLAVDGLYSELMALRT